MDTDKFSNEDKSEPSCLGAVSVLFVDTLAFAEWVDINCVRHDKHIWSYRGDNYKVRYTTEQLYEIYYNER